MIKKYVPQHLLGEYGKFCTLASSHLQSETIEACIAADILTTPQNRLCGEGVLMVVGKAPAP